MGTKFSLLLAGSLSGAIALFATENTDEDKAKAKKEPEVRGSATVTIAAEAYAVEIAKTPNPVVVLDAEKIALVGSPSLDRVIEQTLPGRLVSYGPNGSVQSLFLNGSRSTDTVIIMDGIRISNVNTGGVSLSEYSLTGVDRLEILTGASSTLYGSDAHGGVVSMSSRGPASDGLTGHVLQQTSTLGQVRTGALLLFGWEGGWLQGAIDLEQSPQPTETKKPYRQSSGHMGFGQQFGGTWLFTLNHRSRYQGIPLPYHWAGWPSERVYVYEREQALWQGITTASIKKSFADNLYGEFNLGVFNQKYHHNGSEYDYDEAYTNELEMYQCNFSLIWKHNKGGITLLSDFQNEKYWKNHADQASTGRHTAVALEGNIELLPILRFVASVRQQQDDLEAKANPDRWQDAFDEISISQTTWKMGVNLLMSSGFRAYANTGTAFNAPSLFQLGSNSVVNKPTPDNESSRSTMVGVGYERAKWWIRADVSRISYGSMIQYNYTPEWLLYYENLYNIRVQGLEVSAGSRGNNWNTEIFVRSQEGRRMDWPKETQLEWFQNRPFFSSGIRASWTFTAAELGLNASYIGHRYVYSSDVGGTVPEKNHYIDAAAYARIQLSKALDVTLRAERLFQKSITRDDWELGRDIGRNNSAVLPGYPGLGRALSLEARYKF